MNIACVVIDDGRVNYLRQCVESIQRYVPESLVEAQILIEDEADPIYHAVLRNNFPQFDRQVHHETRRGLAGAVKSAWETALEYDVDYVLHMEGDFVLIEYVQIGAMCQLLSQRPYLAQLVLKRPPDPGNSVEVAAGGIVECAPDQYRECEDLDLNVAWTEHARIFSFNPCLIARSAIECALTEGTDFLEAGVTTTLLQNGFTFAFWGGKFDPPKCDHVGLRRSSGYRW